MSRGIGKTQERILAALADAEFPSVIIAELSKLIGCSDRQIRRAVRSLEQRGMVVVRLRALGHKGIGEYGPLRLKQAADPGFRMVRRHTEDDIVPIPVALTVKDGDPWPLRDGWVANGDAEFYYEGMPTRGLTVSSPHRLLVAYKLRCEHFDRELKESERTELRGMVGGCQLSGEDRALLDQLAPLETMA